MKRWCFRSLTAFVLLGILISSVSSLAQTPPPGEKQPVSTNVWIEYRRDFANWQSQKLLQSLDIGQAGWQQAATQAAQLGGSIQFPDFTVHRAELRSLVSAVSSATDEKQSKEAMTRLQAYIKTFTSGSKERSNDIKRQVEALAASLKERVKKRVEEFVDELKLKSQAEINSEVAIYRRSLLIAVGGKPTTAQRSRIQQSVKEFSQIVIRRKKQQHKPIIDAKIKELSQPDIEGLTKLRQVFKDIDAKLKNHAAQVQTEAKQFRERHLRVVDANLAAELHKWAKLTPEQWANLGIADLEAELAYARYQLAEELEAAYASRKGGAIKQASQAFNNRWQAAAKKVEENRLAAQRKLCETLLPQLTYQEEAVTGYIKWLREQQPGSEAVQAAYQTVLDDVQQLKQICNQVKAGSSASGLAQAFQKLREDAAYAEQAFIRGSQLGPVPNRDYEHDRIDPGGGLGCIS